MGDNRPGPIVIDSIGDPRVAAYANQRDAWLRSRRELEETGLFMAEGELVVRALIDSPARVHSVLLTPERLATIGDALERLEPGVPVYLARGEVMSGIVGFDIHRGILAAGIRPPEPSLDVLLRESGTLVVVEDMANHDNMGGIFRAAAALAPGPSAVLISPRSCDPLYRKAIRVSLGHVLRVPWARLGGWPGELERIKEHGFDLIALSPTAASEPISPSLFDRPPRAALMVGAEGPGLSAGALAKAGRTLRIPITPGVDSLNVTTALAIGLFCLRGGVE